MSKITPALLYGGRAEEALDYYRSIFTDAVVRDVSRNPDGSVLAGTLEFGGQSWTLINGYEAPFTEAVSFMVSCADQDEVDRYWDAITADGSEIACGWCRDRFGMAWQIVPEIMSSLIGDPDPERAARAMQAMMGMKKIVIADMQAAADGTAAPSHPGEGSGS